MKKTIEILVSPQGDVSIDAIGFQGPECEQATRYLEEALGSVRQRQHKAEYHQSQSRKQQQKIHS
jgi:DUF2997 family protein